MGRDFRGGGGRGRGRGRGGGRGRGRGSSRGRGGSRGGFRGGRGGGRGGRGGGRGGRGGRGRGRGGGRFGRSAPPEATIDNCEEIGKFMHSTDKQELIFESTHKSNAVPHFNASIYINRNDKLLFVGQIEDVFGTISHVVCNIHKI